MLHCSQRLCCVVGHQTLRGSISWHISACSLPLQISGLSCMVLSQALKTKCKRFADLCILLPVHHMLHVKIQHNGVPYRLHTRDLHNCSLERELVQHMLPSAPATSSGIVFAFLGLATNLFCLTNITNFLKLLGLPVAFFFLISTQSIAPQAPCSHSVPVALLKCMHC